MWTSSTVSDYDGIVSSRVDAAILNDPKSSPQRTVKRLEWLSKRYLPDHEIAVVRFVDRFPQDDVRAAGLRQFGRAHCSANYRYIDLSVDLLAQGRGMLAEVYFHELGHHALRHVWRSKNAGSPYGDLRDEELWRLAVRDQQAAIRLREDQAQAWMTEKLAEFEAKNGPFEDWLFTG